MTKEIEKIKIKIYPILKKHGILMSSIFGSYAAGQAHRRSDVDLLVKPSAKSTLLDLAALREELESKLGRAVDLVTYKSVSPLLKKQIFGQQYRIL